MSRKPAEYATTDSGTSKRWIVSLVVVVLAIAISAIQILSTTAIRAAHYVYDAPAVARVGVQEIEADGASAVLLGVAWEESASPSVEARGTSTTASARFVATEAGYTASKINITEDGLTHVFDRHIADGSLSAGKSLFSDNVTITRLIADADAVVPGVQGNGNLAYVVDAGRVIGVDRVTGQATSIYTVITKPGGDLVTAFPGSP